MVIIIMIIHADDKDEVACRELTSYFGIWVLWCFGIHSLRGREFLVMLVFFVVLVVLVFLLVFLVFLVF